MKRPNETHTSNTREELAGKVLDLAVGKRHKVVAFQEIEDTRSKEIHDDADVTAVIEAIA